MIRARYSEFLKKISKESGIDEKEIDKKIKQKQAILGGLITLEGAALIVANELGIKFDMQKVKIAELMTGMRNIDVLGKVVRIYPIRIYKQKGGKEGKIASFLLADETASVRVVLWDVSHIALIEEQKIKEGDVLLIKKADVRGTDVKELHLSSKSSIEHSNEKIENVKLTRILSSLKISNLKEGDRALVRAIIVQTFPLKFFPACPECGKRLAEEGNKFYCTEHKETNPIFLPIFSFYIDDGSSNIRAIAFLDSITTLFNLNKEQVLALKDSTEEQEIREKMLGEEFIFEGRVRKNALFSRLEFVVSAISKVDVDKLIEELSKEAGLDT